MKHSLFLSLALATAIVVPVQAKPTKKTTSSRKKAANAIPAVVRAAMPSGARSLFLRKMPMGAGGKLMLVHLWASIRKADNYSPSEFAPSPFCVDVFGWEAKEGTWSRIASTIFSGTAIPGTIADGTPTNEDIYVRWLNPKTKQHPVLIIVSPAYMTTRYTVITYPEDLTLYRENTGYLQDFYASGGSGGGTFYDFGTDARGMMTVLQTSSNYYKKPSETKTVLSWNGSEYVAPPTPKK